MCNSAQTSLLRCFVVDDETCMQIDYPEVQEGEVPRHRFMSAYEQRKEASDRNYQYLLFAVEPYEVIAFKVPSLEVDKAEGKFFHHWDEDAKVYSLNVAFKTQAAGGPAGTGPPPRPPGPPGVAPPRPPPPPRPPMGPPPVLQGAGAGVLPRPPTMPPRPPPGFGGAPGGAPRPPPAPPQLPPVPAGQAAPPAPPGPPRPPPPAASVAPPAT